MQVSTTYQVAAGVVVFLGALLLFILWPYSMNTPVLRENTSEVASSSSTESSSTPVIKQTSTVSSKPFPINTADTIVSWSFKGVDTGNAALTQQTKADAAHLASLLGTGAYDDYDLYIGLGNDSDLTGDGAVAYKSYNHAISIYPNKGLAYSSIAHLMDQLGAYYTAADAYGKATKVEPSVLEYHLERLNYLTRQFPEDTARITIALTDASKQFGDNASILAIEAQWLTGQKRYADAIKAWETVKMLSPGKDTSSIDAEIARLQAKQ